MNSTDLHRKVERHLAESVRVKQAMASPPPVAVAASATAGAAVAPNVRAIVAAAEMVAAAFQQGGKLLLCGNGGSAADCQHMAADLVSRLRSADPPRRALPAIALTTDTSFLTAFSNDESFIDVFARQVEAIGRPGDVLIAISTSGNSANILRAASVARAGGLKVIALTGSGGRLAGMGDLAIAVPHSDVAYVQEAHLAVEHIITELIEDLLFPQRRGGALATEDAV